MYRRALLAATFVLILAPFVSAADHALLVGVEHYRNPRIPVAPGCAGDATSLAGFIEHRFGFPASSIKILTDEQATRARIEREFNDWLIRDSAPGDRVFFLFAGRGTQLPDQNGDEEDGIDEAIVPYDVDPETGENTIRDDLFDSWVSRLSGRRAVLMFDSCFSGTMSRGTPALKEFPQGGGARYLPSAEQFKAFFGLMRGGAVDGANYVLQGNVNRGMEHVSSFVNPSATVRLSGVVVISAARSNQLAYPVKVGGVFRGALSYLFEETQSGSLPSLRTLRDLILARIERMQRDGTIGGSQTPQFEIISSVPLDDYPLFGLWEMSPAVALTNPLSAIRVNVRTAGGQAVYRSTESISYEVSTDTPGYLYLLVFSQQNVATCIFPNESDLNNRVPAGVHTLPRNGSYSFPIKEPYGRDVAVALLSKERLNLCEKVGYSWSEVFDRLNLQHLRQRVAEQATRGVGVSKTGVWPSASDWQAATVITETRP
jgi:hypothetical protein